MAEARDVIAVYREMKAAGRFAPDGDINPNWLLFQLERFATTGSFAPQQREVMAMRVVLSRAILGLPRTQSAAIADLAEILGCEESTARRIIRKVWTRTKRR